jgi:DnaJ-class molecular chaperone
MELEIELEQAYTGCSLPLRVTRTVISRDEYAPVSSFTDNQRTECATVYIEVPMGVDEGEMIRVAGAGHCRHGVCGDVCVTIALKPHEVYRRNGLNLIYTRNISLTDSLCGFSFDIEHFGKTYTICNDVGNVIPSNHRKVIPEKGMHREGHSGDLIVQFKVMYPRTIPLETCEWLRTNLEACPK